SVLLSQFLIHLYSDLRKPLNQCSHKHMNTGSSCSSTMDRPTPTCCVRCLALLRVTGASSWQNWKDTRVSRERQIVDSRLPAESGSLFSITTMFSSRIHFSRS